MRGLALAAAFVACALPADVASAQESQQDIAERIVQEQLDLRARQVEKVMSAPARAWHPLEGGMPDLGGSDEAKPAESAAPPEKPRRPSGLPWVAIIACVAAIPVIALVAHVMRRTPRPR
jgi:hypothetical protein